MFMQPLTSAEIEAYNATATATKNDPQAAQDRFLKLMVAQLSNQDPLNPMDNAEMTSQMAQINTVTGITQLNNTLQGLASQFNSMQSLQATSLIGKHAIVNGNTLGYGADGKGHGGLMLAEDADTVKVQIMGTAGQVIDTIELGGLPAGQHWFDWNSTGVDLSTVAGFKVSASKGEKTVSASALSSLQIESVGMVEGVVRLRTEGGKAFAYADVLAFR